MQLILFVLLGMPLYQQDNLSNENKRESLFSVFSTINNFEYESMINMLLMLSLIFRLYKSLNGIAGYSHLRIFHFAESLHVSFRRCILSLKMPSLSDQFENKLISCSRFRGNCAAMSDVEILS